MNEKLSPQDLNAIYKKMVSESSKTPSPPDNGYPQFWGDPESLAAILKDVEVHPAHPTLTQEIIDKHYRILKGLEPKKESL